MKRYRSGMIGAVMLVGVVSLTPSLAGASEGSYLGRFEDIGTLASTVPANGDQNPYGVAVVPATIGHLTRGNILVSNFNNGNAGGGLQGTGTTIVQVTSDGTQNVFSIIPQSLPSCPGGVGLTTALATLQRGYVVVGSLPTTDGSARTAGAGCLIVLDSSGNVAETFSGRSINGPWDLTALTQENLATLFVTNVLNGTVAGGPGVVNRGTVVRMRLRISYGHAPRLLRSVVVGSGFPEQVNAGSLVVGPTGVGLGEDDTLYVADSLNNRIAAIPDARRRQSSAGTGTTISVNGALNDPLGLAIAPNGNVLTVNGNDGNAVETTPGGTQVKVTTLDSQIGAGTLFGLAVVPRGRGVYFVDDGTNTLNLLD